MVLAVASIIMVITLLTMIAGILQENRMKKIQKAVKKDVRYGLEERLPDNEKNGILRTPFAFSAAFIVGLRRRLEIFLGKDKAPRSVYSYYEKIYAGENCEEVRNREETRTAAFAVSVLFAAALVVVLINASGMYETEYVKSIKRPERGSEKNDLTALYGNESFELSLDVEEARPSRSEMKKRIEALEGRLGRLILGRNESLENVRSDLRLDESYGDESVKVAWSSSDTETLHTDGRVNSSELTEGRAVSLTADIRCYDESRTVQFDLTVFPTNSASADRALLVNNLEELFEERIEDGLVDLPTQLNGKELRFFIPKEDNSRKILGLGFIAAFLTVAMGYEIRQKKLRERETELINDFPEVLSKTTMLLEAGLAIRMAFERISADYEKRKNAGRRKTDKNRRYVYEEMRLAVNEMQLGISETEAYEHFGRRCGSISYIRFASLLSQSVKKGGDSLIPQLQKEISEALKEKQQAVRKKGEEVSVKLLLPVMGMFSLVLALILIPAFMSM